MSIRRNPNYRASSGIRQTERNPYYYMPPERPDPFDDEVHMGFDDRPDPFADEDDIGYLARTGQRIFGQWEQQAGGLITSAARELEEPTTARERLGREVGEEIVDLTEGGILSRAKTLATLPLRLPGMFVGAFQDEVLETTGEAVIPDKHHNKVVGEMRTIGENLFDKGAERIERAGEYGFDRDSEYLKYLGAHALESLGANMGPAMATAYLTRGRVNAFNKRFDKNLNENVISQVAGLGQMGAQVYGMEYERAFRDNGGDDMAARDLATTRMYAETIPEIVPFGMAMKTLSVPFSRFVREAGGFDRALAHLAGTAVSEGLSEVLTEMINTAYDVSELNKEFSLEEFAQQVQDAFLIGAMMGTGMGIPGAAVEGMKPGDQGFDLEGFRATWLNRNPNLPPPGGRDLAVRMEDTPGEGGYDMNTGGRVLGGREHVLEDTGPGPTLPPGGGILFGSEDQAPGTVDPRPPGGGVIRGEPDPFGGPGFEQQTNAPGGAAPVPYDPSQAAQYANEEGAVDPFDDGTISDEEFDSLFDDALAEVQGAEEGKAGREAEADTGPAPEQNELDTTVELAWEDIKDDDTLEQYIGQINAPLQQKLDEMRGDTPEQIEAFNKRWEENKKNNVEQPSQKQAVPNPAKDDLLQTIRKAGGLNAETWFPQGTQFREAAKDKGVNNKIPSRLLFSNHKSSKTPDGLAEYLNQSGVEWVPEKYLDNGQLTANTVLELVSDALVNPEEFGGNEYQAAREVEVEMQTNRDQIESAWRDRQARAKVGQDAGIEDFETTEGSEGEYADDMDTSSKALHDMITAAEAAGVEKFLIDATVKSSENNAQAISKLNALIEDRKSEDELADIFAGGSSGASQEGSTETESGVGTEEGVAQEEGDTDILGENTETEQKLADEQRRRDEKRSGKPGEETPTPESGEGGLLGGGNTTGDIFPGTSLPGESGGISKPPGDGGSTAAQLFGNRSYAETISTKGFDSLDVDVQHVVLSKVRAALDDKQILDSVVNAIPIDVVNTLVGKQLSSDTLLDNMPMLRDRLSVSRDKPIPQPVTSFINSLASAVVRGPASPGAKETNLGGESGVVDLPGDGDGTPQTSGVDDGHTEVTVGNKTDTVNVNPTEGQKEAGTYKKGHFSIHGLNISIENPKGSLRKGKGWQVRMKDHYGYLKRTEGADGEQVDIFIGPEAKNENPTVAIVDQRNEDGSFDEHKVIIGYEKGKAEETYFRNYNDEFREMGLFAGLSEITLDEFKTWLKEGDLKKPFGDTFAKEKTDEQEQDGLPREEAGSGRQQGQEGGERLPGPEGQQPQDGAGNSAEGSGKKVKPATEEGETATPPAPQIPDGQPKYVYRFMAPAEFEAAKESGQFAPTPATQRVFVTATPEQAVKWGEPGSVLVRIPNNGKLKDRQTADETHLTTELMEGLPFEGSVLMSTREEFLEKQKKDKEPPPPLELDGGTEKKAEKKEKKKPAEKKKRKLENTGADLRRWWDKLKAEQEAAKTPGDRLWSLVKAQAARPKVYAPTPGPDATPGVQRYYNDIRNTLWTITELAPRALTGRRPNPRGYYKRTADDIITDALNSDESGKNDAKLMDFAREYSLMMKTLSDHLSGANTIDEAEAKLAEIIDTEKYPGHHSYTWNIHVKDGAPKVTMGEKSWHPFNDSDIIGLIRGRHPERRTGEARLGLQGHLESENTTEEKKKRKILRRPKIDKVERESETSVRDGDVTPKQFKEEFGFADVGFGTYVRAGKDQTHLNHAWDAFADLADIMGVPHKMIGFFATLHFTIGALGQGKAAAHYQNSQPHPDGGHVPVINLTNTRGDGTVAHEWGHAFDYLGLNQSDNGRKILEEILDALKLSKDISVLERRLEQGLNGYYYMNTRFHGPRGSVENITALMEHWRRKGKDTSYFKEAKKLDKGKGDKPYWSNDRELFARAWEAFIYDTLKGKKRSNNYLVSSWVKESKVTNASGYRGIPYPREDERKNINGVMDALIKAISVEGDKIKFNVREFRDNLPPAIRDYEERADALIESIPRRVEEHKAEKERKRKEAEAERKRQAEMREKERREAEEQKQKEEADAWKKAVEQAKANQKIKAEEERLRREEEQAAAEAGDTSNIEAGETVTDEEFDRLFDEASAIVNESESETPAEATPSTESKVAQEQRPTRESVRKQAEGEAVEKEGFDSAAAIRAAKELGVEGMEDAVKGMAKLFGNKSSKDRQRGSVSLKDDPDYLEAKKYFEQSRKKFQAAGKNLRDLMVYWIQNAGEQIKAYLKAWKDEEGVSLDLSTREERNERLLDTDTTTGGSETGSVSGGSAAQDGSGTRDQGDTGTGGGRGGDGRGQSPGGRTGSGSTSTAGGTGANVAGQSDQPGGTVGDTEGVGSLPNDAPAGTGQDGGSQLDSATGSADPAVSGQTANNRPASSGINAGSEFQTPYESGSEGFNEDVLVPVNMKGAIDASLAALKAAVGNLDQYVMDKLGYTDMVQFREAFMGLQVDTIASAIYNHEAKDRAIIIADQTGVGKGRQAAAIIRYALRHGYTPVFVTEKVNLFTDMYDDLADIYESGVKPFLMNDKAFVSLRKTRDSARPEKLFMNKGDDRKNGIKAMLAGKLPVNRNAIFTTYSQFNVLNDQRRGMMKLKETEGIKPFFILDEAHNVSGQRETLKKGETRQTGAGFFYDLIAEEPVTYLSATYAKRPDNMPIFFRTDLIDAVDDISELASAIERGGEALQTVLAAMLTKAGQLWRRERSFDGIEFKSTEYTEGQKEHIRLKDSTTYGLRTINEYDKAFHDYITNTPAGSSTAFDHGGIPQSERYKYKIYHHPFSAIVHNFVRQLLLSLKVDIIADQAIEQIENGQKVVIALENTMESFVSAEIKRGNLRIGKEWDGDYRSILHAALDNTLRYMIKHRKNKAYENRQTFPAEQLPQNIQDVMDAVHQMIDQLDISKVELFYIDYIRNRLAKHRSKKYPKGISVSELTGRQYMMDYSSGKPVLKNRPAAEKNRRGIVDGFNDGKIDALIINAAGATGLSIHASEKFKDQKPRKMYVAQAMGNINTVMQALGRVNRTGQVIEPSYDYMSLALPSEQRPAAMTLSKMRSLNANTSANTESETSKIDVSQIFNKYGDEIVRDFLKDHSEFAALVGMNKVNGDKVEPGIAQKFTGKLALAPHDREVEAWDYILNAYECKINLLNATGQNDLVVEALDIDARIISNRILHEGKDNTTVFGGDAIMHKVSVKRQGRPPTGDDVLIEIAEALGEKTGLQHANDMIAELDKQDVLGRELDQAVRDPEMAKPENREAAITATERRNDHNEVRRSTERQLRRFQIGKAFKLDLGEGLVTGVVTAVESTHKMGHGSPWSQSKIRIKFVTNTPLRPPPLALSQILNQGLVERDVSIYGPDQLKNIFDQGFFISGREQRFIVTGNLIAGFAHLETKGRVVQFRAGDGKYYQGILMPKAWGLKGEYDALGVNPFIVRDGTDAYKYLKAIRDNRAMRAMGVHSSTQNVRLYHNGYAWVLATLKKNTQDGSRVSGDPQLIEMLGKPEIRGTFKEFVFNGGEYVSESRQLRKVIDRVLELVPLYVPASGKDIFTRETGKDFKETTQFSFDGGADNLGLEYDPRRDDTERDPHAPEPKYQDVGSINLGSRPRKKRGKAAGGRRTNATRRLEGVLRKHEGFIVRRGSILEVAAPAELKGTLKAIQKVFGKKVIFVRMPPGMSFFNGVVLPSDPKTVYVNIESENPYLSVVGHEVLHHLRRENPALYNKLSSIALEYMKPEALEAFTERLNRVTKSRKRLDENKVLEEMVANVVGEAFADKAFIDELAGRDPSLFQKVMKAIVDFLNAVLAKLRKQGMGNGRYFRETDAMMSEVKNTIRAFRAAQDAGMTGPIAEEAAPVFHQINGNEDAPQFQRKLSENLNEFYEKVATPSFRNRVNKTFDRINSITAHYHALGNLPYRDDYLKRRYEALGQIAKAQMFSERVTKAFKNASQADKDAVFEYLTKRDAHPIGIQNPAVRANAVRIKKIIDRVGQQLVAAGFISQESYEEYRDQYLPRLYLKHLLKADAWKDLGGGKKASRMGYRKHRKDIPSDIREVILGEVTDPGFLASVSLGRSIRDMAILDFLEDVSKHHEWVHPNFVVEYNDQMVSTFWLRDEAIRLEEQARHMRPEPAEKARQIAAEMRDLLDNHEEGLPIEDLKNYKQMPKSNQYGRLKGIWVRKEIYNDLMGVTGYPSHEGNPMESLFGYGGAGTKITQWWKISKVALNPPTQIRNFMSNMILLNLSGVPLHRIPKLIRQAAKQIANDGPAWKAAKKYGITQTTFNNAEMVRLHRDLTQLQRKHVKGPKKARVEIRNIAEYLADKGGSLYQLSESLIKTAKIIDATGKGMSPDDAALEAHKWLFDYSLVPRWVGYLRNMPIGMPFLTFYYKVLPRMAEVITRHPLRLAPYALAPIVWQFIVAAMHDIDDPDDLDKLRMAYPEWIRENGHLYLLPWKDGDGRWQFFDFSYLLPWTLPQNVVTKLAKGEVREAFTETGMFSAPVATVITALTVNIDPFTQREIISDADPLGTQVAKMVGYVWSLAMPTIATEHGAFGKFLEATGFGAMDNLDDVGRPRTTVPQALLRAVGMNVYSVDPELTRAQNIRNMKYELQQIKTKMRRELKNKGLTEKQKDRIKDSYMTHFYTQADLLADYIEESKLPDTVKVESERPTTEGNP